MIDSVGLYYGSSANDPSTINGDDPVILYDSKIRTSKCYRRKMRSSSNGFQWLEKNAGKYQETIAFVFRIVRLL